MSLESAEKFMNGTAASLCEIMMVATKKAPTVKRKSHCN